jgi:hypothetical protein
MNSRRTAVFTAGIVAIVAVALVLPVAARAASLDEIFAPQAFGTVDTRPAPAPKASPLTLSEKLGVAVTDVPAVTLERLDTEALLQEDLKAATVRNEKIQRVGIGRKVDVTAADGDWYALPGGRNLWVGEVASIGAVRMRLHFAGVRLPRGAELAVYPVDADGNKRRGADDPVFFDAGSAAVSFWTGDLSGDRLRIEYLQPRARKSAELPFRVDGLQHLYLDPTDPSLEGYLKAAGNCHNDVTCFAAWATIAKSVARITFVSGGSTFLCTGQLMNAQNSDLTPYFLTANHCVSTSTVAGTVKAYWFYQTSTCNGAAPSLASSPTSTGATLLSTGASSDYTLLMLEGGLPSGTAWTGWTSAAVADGTASTGIHHPSGDYKRISFGNKASNTTCGGANHVRINWTSGVTEGGSSGSGIWRNDTQQLFGQLHCGTSACGNVTNDDYGAFSSTYPNISTLLAAGSDDASEDNDTCATARAVSAGTLSSRIVKSTDSDWYSISVPAGHTVTVTLTFTHANGDIDTKMYTTCGGAAVASSTGTTGTETMSWTNTGGSAVTVKWQVYLFSDTRNTYNINVSI